MNGWLRENSLLSLFLHFMSLLTLWPCLIFTKFSQLGPGLNTVRTHLSAISKKKWVIFRPLWFRITNYSSHCGELYLPLSTFRNAFCSNRNFQETWHVSRELRLDGRVGFLNEHQEKVHLGAISHGLHDTACFVCIKTNFVLAASVDY